MVTCCPELVVAVLIKSLLVMMVSHHSGFDLFSKLELKSGYKDDNHVISENKKDLLIAIC